MVVSKITKLPEPKSGPQSALDTIKWIFIVAFFALGVYANHHFSATVALPIRLIAWLVLLMALGGLAFWTQRGRQFWSFLKLVQDELRRVVWPNRQETLQATAVVVAMVVVVALFLWGIDSLLLLGMGFLTGSRG